MEQLLEKPTKAAPTLPLVPIEVDLCIIEQQKDHTVFAVRVPNDAIKKNHTFLAAVSDVVSGDKLCSFYSGGACRQGEPIRKAAGGLNVSAAGWIAALALSAFLVPWNGLAALFREPPVEWLSRSLVQESIHLGEPAVIQATVIQRENCYGNVMRVWRRESDGAVIYMNKGDFVGGVAKDAPTIVSHQWPQPRGLVPGHYTLGANVALNCDGGPYNFSPQPLKVEVTP